MRFFSLLALASVFVAGCAVDSATEVDDDAVSAEEAIKAGITAGTFKLYDEPRHEPNASCDVHTAIDLSSYRSGSRIDLRETVGGLCEIYVDPQERFYRLRFDGTACGSRIYKGKKKINGKTRDITVTDHRTRICRDLVPAKIIVEETDQPTKYSFDGTPAASVSTYLTIAPKQCGTNPWEPSAQGLGGSQTGDEVGQVKSYFSSKGIELEAIGFAYPAEPMAVCLACSCPRGDTLVVKAKDAADAQKLISNHGFAEATDAMTTAPKQCGTNPWDEAQDSRVESQNISSWAKTSGAPLAAAGLLDYTEPRMVCMACQCPRGDIAIAFPSNASAATKLENLGWARVEN
jgi:hypothetical protein